MLGAAEAASSITARAVGEHPQPVGFQHVGVVDEASAGGVVGQRRPWWLVAVAVAVALVAQILWVAGPVAGWRSEVAVQDRPAGGVLVDQVTAGGLGVAVEVASDRVEQDAALVGGVAVVVAVNATEAAFGGGAMGRGLAPSTRRSAGSGPRSSYGGQSTARPATRGRRVG